MLDNIEVICQSAIKFSLDKNIYFDPFKIKDRLNDADYIFITHDHYDHYDVDSINNIRKDSTKIIIPSSLLDSCLNIFSKENILVVEPLKDYVIDDIKFSTVPAYNINKNFHPRSNNWVGYVINLNNYTYYIMGDTDAVEEAKNVSCDVLFIPIGGTYTMNYEEASKLTNIINPKIAVPIHYGTIVGSKSDGTNFINLINTEGKELMKWN